MGKLQTAAKVLRREGVSSLLHRSLHAAFERPIGYQRFTVIVLERGALRPPTSPAGISLSSRLATREDLESMRKAEGWRISDQKVEWHERGYRCFLSEVDGRMAGYTWAHDHPTALLIEGL